MKSFFALLYGVFRLLMIVPSGPGTFVNSEKSSSESDDSSDD